MELVQVGWFVTGRGKFGNKEFGDAFEPKTESSEESSAANYWKARGYEMIPVFVPVVKHKEP